MSILNAGSSAECNLSYFPRSGCRVFAIAQNPQAIEYVRDLAWSMSLQLSAEDFQVSNVEEMSFPNEHFDVVISSAVLHFAGNEKHFGRMLTEMWCVLKSDGLLFIRLASTIGIENKIKLIEERRYLLPDGSERFLVDEE